MVELLEPKPNQLTKPKNPTMVTSEKDFITSLKEMNTADDASEAGDGKTVGGAAAAVVAAAAFPSDFTLMNSHTNSVLYLKTLRSGEKIEVKFSYRIMSPPDQPVSIVVA